MSNTKTYAAFWHSYAKYYVVAIAGRILTSTDGDVWIDTVTTAPAEFAEFEVATIYLTGGPRDGEDVA